METEVLIIGGGPAGATCGSLLRQRGVDCLIVDHADFPRDKVCGGGLTPRGWMRGAYIYQSNDYPVREHIILIGDAGGFCNRLSGEGLYDAFLTASNAAQAIASGVPFAQTNRKVFRKKKLEGHIKRLFYSGTGFALLRLMSRWPRLVKWCFDHGVDPAA